MNPNPNNNVIIILPVRATNGNRIGQIILNVIWGGSIQPPGRFDFNFFTNIARYVNHVGGVVRARVYFIDDPRPIQAIVGTVYGFLHGHGQQGMISYAGGQMNTNSVQTSLTLLAQNPHAQNPNPNVQNPQNPSNTAAFQQLTSMFLGPCCSALGNPSIVNAATAAFNQAGLNNNLNANTVKGCNGYSIIHPDPTFPVVMVTTGQVERASVLQDLLELHFQTEIGQATQKARQTFDQGYSQNLLDNFSKDVLIMARHIGRQLQNFFTAFITLSYHLGFLDHNQNHSFMLGPNGEVEIAVALPPLSPQMPQNLADLLNNINLINDINSLIENIDSLLYHILYLRGQGGQQLNQQQLQLIITSLSQQLNQPQFQPMIQQLNTLMNQLYLHLQLQQQNNLNQQLQTMLQQIVSMPQWNQQQINNLLQTNAISLYNREQQLTQLKVNTEHLAQQQITQIVQLVLQPGQGQLQFPLQILQQQLNPPQQQQQQQQQLNTPQQQQKPVTSF